MSCKINILLLNRPNYTPPPNNFIYFQYQLYVQNKGCKVVLAHLWSNTITALKEQETGTSLVVQWLRLHAPNAGGPGSIPGQGTRSHMHATTKSLHAATKTWRSQINK